MDFVRLRAIYKLFVISILLLTMFVSIAILYFFGIYEKYNTKVVRRLIKIINQIIGLNIKMNPHSQSIRDGFIVSNHLSYLDIFIIYQYFTCTFVTSTQMRDSFFMGKIIRTVGCIFVNRKSIRSMKNEIEIIRQKLDNGNIVAFFPEATTTDGSVLLPFRSSLLEAAKKSKKHIYPLVINYKMIDGNIVSKKNRDLIFWYADMTFVSHLFEMCKCKSIDAEVSVLNPLVWDEYNDRKILANQAYQKIKSKLDFVGESDLSSCDYNKFYGDRVYNPYVTI